MANLDFEKHINELERKITDLKKFAASENIDLSAEIRRLEEKLEKEKRSTYKRLTAWQRVQLARHPQRPYTLDYIGMIMTDFMEIHGDRHFGDDQALICGFARIEKQRILIMGHQKGRDTNENLIRNFGSAHPEGYRKAMRVMKLAEKFSIPIVTFIDTPGAYPGIGAEERGQAEAIAYNLREMAQLKVPIIVFVIGEGGSGGALGIGVGDKILVLENAYYSVISPEGCAAILWKERKRAPEASETLKLTAEALLEFGIIDEVVKEPLGGAHRDAEATALNIKRAILKYLPELRGMSTTKLLDARYDKFRKIGVFTEESTKKGKEKS